MHLRESAVLVPMLIETRRAEGALARAEVKVLTRNASQAPQVGFNDFLLLLTVRREEAARNHLASVRTTVNQYELPSRVSTGTQPP
jgi:hypothetical protein